MFVIVGAMLMGLAATADEPLRLSCKGYSETSTEHASLNFLAKGGVSTRTYYGTRRDSRHILVELQGGEARVHLPKAMIPAVNSGGEDSWWKVSDLKVTEGAISGRIRINMIEKPSFNIDRTTGDMDLGGGYAFRGACEKTTQTERKF